MVNLDICRMGRFPLIPSLFWTNIFWKIGNVIDSFEPVRSWAVIKRLMLQLFTLRASIQHGQAISVIQNNYCRFIAKSSNKLMINSVWNIFYRK